MKRKAFFFRILLPILLLCLLTLWPAGPVHAAPAAPMQFKKKLTLARYRKVKLTLKNVSGTISWSSSDPKVATVTKRGIVRTKNTGKCRITASICRKGMLCSSA